MTVIEAARATSAAPTYFPPFNCKNRKLLDGGMEANCPLTVALQEALLIWPNHSFDVCVSVGNNGTVENTKFSDDVCTFMKTAIDLVASTEKGIKEASTLLELLHKEDSLIRINPKLNKDFSLEASDDKSMNEIERVTKSYIASSEGSQLLDKTCALLMVSLFCCNIEDTITPFEIKGRIFSRLELLTPQNILQQLKASAFTASLLIDSPSLYKSTFNWDEDTCTMQFTLKFYLAGSFPLIIKCNGLPISGCPITLSVIGSSVTDSEIPINWDNK